MLVVQNCHFLKNLQLKLHEHNQFKKLSTFLDNLLLKKLKIDIIK